MCGVKRTQNIDLDHTTPIFWVCTIDQAQQDQPSIIDQNIHAAERLLSTVDDLIGLRLMVNSVNVRRYLSETREFGANVRSQSALSK